MAASDPRLDEGIDTLQSNIPDRRVSSTEVPQVPGAASYWLFGSALAHVGAVHTGKVNVHVDETHGIPTAELIAILQDEFSTFSELKVRASPKPDADVTFEFAEMPPCGCDTCSCMYLGGPGAQESVEGQPHYHDDVGEGYLKVQHIHGYSERIRRAVIRHEFGHALGLAHSTNNTGLMFPTIQPNVEHFDKDEQALLLPLMPVEAPPRPKPEEPDTPPAWWPGEAEMAALIVNALEGLPYTFARRISTTGTTGHGVLVANRGKTYLLDVQEPGRRVAASNWLMRADALNAGIDETITVSSVRQALGRMGLE